jgi:hypothetical protein
VRVIGLVVVLGVLLGCHKGATGPAGPFAGHWMGDDAAMLMTLDMRLSDNGGSVSGQGSLAGSIISGGYIPITLSGTSTGTTCSLTENAPPYTHMTITGVLVNDTTVQADLNGSGFGNYTVTLYRQAH